MTTDDLALQALPYVRHALKSARPAIIERIGYAGMLAIWPSWSAITGPLLPLLIRLGIELAIGLIAPNLLLLLLALERLLEALPEGYVPAEDRAKFRELILLMKTPTSQMHPVVRETLQVSPDALRD